MDTLIGGEKLGLRAQNCRPSSLGGWGRRIAKFKVKAGNLVISCLKIKRSKQTNITKEDGAEARINSQHCQTKVKRMASILLTDSQRHLARRSTRG